MLAAPFLARVPHTSPFCAMCGDFASAVVFRSGHRWPRILRPLPLLGRRHTSQETANLIDGVVEDGGDFAGLSD
jgi:hypothetical protein